MGSKPFYLQLLVNKITNKISILLSLIEFLNNLFVYENKSDYVRYASVFKMFKQSQTANCAHKKTLSNKHLSDNG